MQTEPSVTRVRSIVPLSLRLAALLLLAGSAGCAPASDEPSESSADALSDAQARAAARLLGEIADHPDAVDVAGEIARLEGRQGQYRVYVVPASVVDAVESNQDYEDPLDAAMDPTVGGLLVVGDNGFLGYFTPETGATAVLGDQGVLEKICDDFGSARELGDSEPAENASPTSFGGGLRLQGLPTRAAIRSLVRAAVQRLFQEAPKIVEKTIPAAVDAYEAERMARATAEGNKGAASWIRQTLSQLRGGTATIAARVEAKVMGAVGEVPGVTTELLARMRSVVQGTIAVDREAAAQVLRSKYVVFAHHESHADVVHVADRLAKQEGAVWLSEGTGWVQNRSVVSEALPGFRQVELVRGTDVGREIDEFVRYNPGRRWLSDFVLTWGDAFWTAQRVANEMIVSVKGDAIKFYTDHGWDCFRIYQAVHAARMRIRYPESYGGELGNLAITIVHDARNSPELIERVIARVLNDGVMGLPIRRQQLNITYVLAP